MLNFSRMVGSRGFLSLYWSSTHSRAERLPEPVLPGSGSGTPASVVRSSRVIVPPLLVGPQDGPLRVNVLSVVALQRDTARRTRTRCAGPAASGPSRPSGGSPGYRGRRGNSRSRSIGVFVAVGGIVQHGVGVGENLLGGDAILSGQCLEVVAPLLPVVPVDLVDAPPGDVAHPLPVLRVAVEGEALGGFQQVIVRKGGQLPGPESPFLRNYLGSRLLCFRPASRVGITGASDIFCE